MNTFLTLFYSSDHLPVYVHVQIDKWESKAESLFLENELKILFKKVKGKGPLSLAEAKEIAVFLKTNANKIIEKSNKVFILNQKVDCEKIRVKIKRTKK